MGTTQSRMPPRRRTGIGAPPSGASQCMQTRGGSAAVRRVTGADRRARLQRDSARNPGRLSPRAGSELRRSLPETRSATHDVEGENDGHEEDGHNSKHVCVHGRQYRPDEPSSLPRHRSTTGERRWRLPRPRWVTSLLMASRTCGSAGNSGQSTDWLPRVAVRGQVIHTPAAIARVDNCMWACSASTGENDAAYSTTATTVARLAPGFFA